MISIKLDRCFYDDDVVMFQKPNRTFDEGLTVLIGCNGSGKTTIINVIENKYTKHSDEYAVIKWNGLFDKGKIRDAALKGNLSFFSQLWCSSEGEEISLNIGAIASDIGRAARGSDKKIIVLLDAVDSGLSIDNIVEFKTFIHDTLLPDMKKEGKEIYIIVAANSYEMVHGENCVDARTGKQKSFKTYDSYKKYILKSRADKEARYE